MFTKIYLIKKISFFICIKQNFITFANNFLVDGERRHIDFLII